MRESLNSYLDQCLEHGEATAYAYQRGLRTTKWSYRKLAETAFQFARELERRNINKGDRALLWGENRPEWVAAFFGCLLRGVVVVPLDEHSAPDFVDRVQAQVSAKLLVRGDEIDYRGLLPALRFDQFEAALSGHSKEKYASRSVSIDDLAEIIFTSGTTAEPKGVRLTHRNLLANLNPLEAEIAKYSRYERPFHPLRFLCLLPLSHVFGQFMGIFVAQILGGEAFFQSSLNPSEILAAVKRERISVIAAVPRQLDALKDKVERDIAAKGGLERFKARFAAAEGRHYLRRWWMFRDVHWKFGFKFLAFVSGGATLEEETENFWLRMGFAVVQGYGMTETASLISLNHPFKPSRGSIGKSLPGREMKLDDNGEILVRGENVSGGYWRGGADQMTVDHGWLRTGDVGALDAEGNLYFKGRKKDVIVTAAGLNIYPDDLEAALNRQPEVRASCVIGVEGPHGPEPLAALVLGDERADPAEIVRRANESLNQSQRIRRWLIWPEPDFPRTATRKIRKPLVSEFVKGRNEGVAVAPAKAGSLAELVASIGGDANASGGELKLDSLGRVQLLSAIEDRYQIELDEAAITPATTIRDIERMIHENAPAAEAIEYPYPGWSRRAPVTWLRFIAYYLLVAPFVTFMCLPMTRGKENLKKLKGPALFIANHISMVDPGMILFALPFRYRHRLAIAMAGERLRSMRRPGAGPLAIVELIKYLLVVTVFNVFPLPQKSGFRRSFGFAGEAVDQGFSVLVFPEGRTTEDGRMNPFMAGIGLLAINLDIPVVPIKIEGLFDLKKQRRYFSKPGTVRVIFGEPVKFDADADPAMITAELESRVRNLGEEPIPGGSSSPKGR